MVEGTKQFKGRKSSSASSSAPENSPQQSDLSTEKIETKTQEPLPARENEESNAVNLGRREWFGSLVPAFGDGLVKLLRSSNNLQRDIHEAIQGQANHLLAPQEKKDSEK